MQYFAIQANAHLVESLPAAVCVASENAAAKRACHASAGDPILEAFRFCDVDGSGALGAEVSGEDEGIDYQEDDF